MLVKRLIAGVCAIAALGFGAVVVSTPASPAAPQACGVCWY